MPNDETPSDASVLRALPQVQRLMETARAHALVEEFSRPRVLSAVRSGLDERRRDLLAGGGAATPFSAECFLDEVEARLRREQLRGLQRVINATGIIIHTNLGRAPLAAAAIDAVVETARGYSSLELDLATGGRGSRYRAPEALLHVLTGAEAALVVNNNAAAVLLALGALARGGEVVVSRGELVEIGGSFRIPDIIAASGARLVEVGTSNKTRLADYERAITSATRVILKVHQSNFCIIGFTSAAPIGDLAALARRRGLVLMADLGSGTLVDLGAFGLPRESTVCDSLAAGADIVTFSGDKLLGGPQAGIILGRGELIARLRSEPLLRAVRVDKLALAALAATLKLYLDRERLPKVLPVLAMLAQSPRDLGRRAGRLARLLGEVVGGEIRIANGVAYVGGGALPGEGIPTRLVTVRAAGVSLEALARRLREQRPAIIGRIADGWFVMDMRTVAEADLPDIARAFRKVLA